MTTTSIEKAARALLCANATVPTPVPGLAVLLRQLMNDDVDFDELVVTLERFPPITARILAVANSAWCAPALPITSLQSACTHLGLRLIRSISISLVVSSPFDTMRCPAFDSTRFWHSCLLVADGAVSLVPHCDEPGRFDYGALQTSGLLHNLGLLWLADKLPDDISYAFELVACGRTTSVNGALVERIGMDISEISSELLRTWRLPKVITTVVAHYRDAGYGGDCWRQAALVGGAVELVSALRNGNDYPTRTPCLDRLEIPEDAYLKVFDKLQQMSDHMMSTAAALRQH